MGAVLWATVRVATLGTILAVVFADTDVKCRNGYAYQGFDAHKTYSDAAASCKYW
jgi:hypothetical protein